MAQWQVHARRVATAAALTRARLAVFHHRHPWLDWAFVYLCGGLYCLILRVRNLPAFVEVYSDANSDSHGLRARGVFLGMLEDFCLLSYLMLALWAYDWLALQLSRCSDVRSARRILEDGGARDERLNPSCSARFCCSIGCGSPSSTSRLAARLKTFARVSLRFLVFLVLFAASVAFFVADYVLLRARKLRFTVDWITMYLNDDGAASTVEIPKEEVRLAVTSTVVCVLVSFAFALVNVVCKTDLSRWSPAQLVPGFLRLRGSNGGKTRSQSKLSQRSNSKDGDNVGDAVDVVTPQPKRASIYYIVMDSEGEGDAGDRPRFDSIDILHTESDSSSGGRGHHNGLVSRVCAAVGLVSSSAPSTHPSRFRRRLTAMLTVFWALAFATLCLVALPLAAMSLAQHATPAVAQIALNTNLNEALRALTDNKELLVPTVASAEISTGTVNSLYIHNATENFTLFADDVLYRRTHGFLGERSLNVSVDPEDPPNVLLLVIESFRHRDSKYLVGESGSYLMSGDANLTVTPNFDRWAARGVAFNNFWSSYRTSRSVESIQFAQLPYDSVTDSGTTGGKADVQLSGLPQLFTALGYDTLFATGCRTDYDQWDAFLPSHGFDEVLDVDEFKAFAESDLGIQPQDWLDDKDGGQRRAHSYWGVHDDLSFDVLGSLLVNKSSEQAERVAAGQPKRPTFTTFYSISSHVPYWEHPKWWDDYEDKPDLSALYESATEYGDGIHRYADLRYFQDLALGKFLDRMQDEGVLNDTIVFVVGDHGQAPENGCDKYIEDAQESTTHVAAALIAEGRLGDAAGSIFEDAAQHYDLLNTLADMVGVPEGGFVQSGVGRSLLRAVPFGERVVWSNNPAKKMAAIRGTTRIEYDRESSAVSVFETRSDHNELSDLYPSLSYKEKEEIDAIRDAGRSLNMYFKDRWDKKCILSVEC